MVRPDRDSRRVADRLFGLHRQVALALVGRSRFRGDEGMNHRGVDQLRARHAALAWWLKIIREHGPCLTIPVAARVLRVSRNRVRAMIARGRLQIVQGMPGGTRTDVFVPLEGLIDAPFSLNRGRPGLFGVVNRKKFAPPRKGTKPVVNPLIPRGSV